MDEEVAAFCDRVYASLVGTLTLYCGDRHVAEEIAQETLVRIWDRWASVRDMGAPVAWAHRVALNLANSWFRRKAAERRATARLSLERPRAHTDLADELALREAVAALPRRQRSVLVLRYYADLPIDQTADLMGCSPGTVKSLTNRATRTLRERGFARDVEVLDGR